MTPDIHERVAERLCSGGTTFGVDSFAAILKEEYGPILAAAIAVVQNPHFETCECRVCKLRIELEKKGLF